MANTPDAPTTASQYLDINRERENATFNVRKMTELLYSKYQLDTAERMRKIVNDDVEFQDCLKDRYFRTDRIEIMKNNLRKLKRVLQITKEMGLNTVESWALRAELDIGGIGLHDGVFLPNIMGMSTPEQYAAWVEKAQNYETIGCYAQTEMGHGSNVRGLMTTATFDEETDEFIINTPCLEATKWWPGGMGLLANVAVLYARLIVKGNDLGVQNFYVPIRDFKTHEPLPGVTVGDIGPKWATNNNDNGYLQFDHVRIPRFNMLMKHAKLDRQGNYTKPERARANYATMTRVRSNIVSGSSQSVAKAATITVRYSAVRRQAPGASSQASETQVLDYVSQQWRILPTIADSYALFFTGKYMIQLLDQSLKIEEEGGEGGAELGAELHAASCSLKSLCTTIAADGIEECRRSCGGYGFQMASGLPTLYASYMQSFTPEGDNYLLTQQTSKYLMRAFRLPDGSSISNETSASYLKANAKERGITLSTTSSHGDDSHDSHLWSLSMMDNLLRGYQNRAIYLVEITDDSISSGNSFTSELVEHYRMSRAHGMVIIMEAFKNGIAICEDPSLKQALGKLYALFAFSHMEKDLGEFVECGFVLPTQINYVRRAVRQLCAAVRPDAVALVDAFDFSDTQLGSAIGKYDGNVYPALFEQAKRNPLNQKGVDWGYQQFLKPIIQNKL